MLYFKKNRCSYEASERGSLNTDINVVVTIPPVHTRVLDYSRDQTLNAAWLTSALLLFVSCFALLSYRNNNKTT